MRWVCVVAIAWLTGSEPLLAAPPQSGCVAVQAVARYVGPGYNHLASTQNGCKRAVQCELWTDVDPDAHHVVELQPQATADTVFRVDSPAYGFRVHYRCQYLKR